MSGGAACIGYCRRPARDADPVPAQCPLRGLHRQYRGGANRCPGGADRPREPDAKARAHRGGGGRHGRRTGRGAGADRTRGARTRCRSPVRHPKRPAGARPAVAAGRGRVCDDERDVPVRRGLVWCGRPVAQGVSLDFRRYRRADNRIFCAAVLSQRMGVAAGATAGHGCADFGGHPAGHDDFRIRNHAGRGGGLVRRGGDADVFSAGGALSGPPHPGGGAVGGGGFVGARSAARPAPWPCGTAVGGRGHPVPRRSAVGPPRWPDAGRWCRDRGAQ